MIINMYIDDSPGVESNVLPSFNFQRNPAVDL